MPTGVLASFGTGWSITVVSTSPNGNAAVAAEDQFNKPPDAGKQFFLATVAITYTGDDSDSFSSSDLEAVGPSNVGYTTFSNSCGVIPNELPSNEISSGGTIQGNVCWEVLSTDADELLMYYDRVSLQFVDRTYWSLATP